MDVTLATGQALIIEKKDIAGIRQKANATSLIGAGGDAFPIKPGEGSRLKKLGVKVL